MKWPKGQLLPTMSTPASTLDLISLSTDYTYRAKYPSMRHEIGRPVWGGWGCRKGVDLPDRLLVYGPGDTSIPAGPNNANFNLKIDNNSANDDKIATIDVVDMTANKVIASQIITRKQFTTITKYQTFGVPFHLSSTGHAIEVRVRWPGTSNLAVSGISIMRSPMSDKAVLFSSLQGLVNRTQPRIYTHDDNSIHEEGKYTWLKSLGLHAKRVDNPWKLISKYRHEIKGVVVYDDLQPDTLNLATTIAGSEHALVAPPMLLSRLTSAPYHLPILADLRGKYADKLAVYRDLYEKYWPKAPHRVLMGLNPTAHFAAAREYAAAIDAAVVWLDPRVPEEDALLKKFLASMGPGSVYMGWWPDEASGVGAASAYGIATCASDWSTNLSVFGGTHGAITPKPIPPKPALENKIYVAFIISDGDNFQYVEHHMRKIWDDPNRGRVPMGWTLSPAMVDAMPGVLHYYQESATPNDCLISGPSGYGYTYPNDWTNQAYLNEFVAKSGEYCRRAGFRIITIWNTITGGIDPKVGETYAKHAPSLLGLTAQNAGGGSTIYNSSMPGEALAATYCPTIDSVKMQIKGNSEGWTGKSPSFLIIQSQPWGNVTPTGLESVMKSLGPDYVVVRPDTIFQLIREANHLAIDPTADGALASDSK